LIIANLIYYYSRAQTGGHLQHTILPKKTKSSFRKVIK